MLSIVMLSVTIKSIMLSVIMLNVVMLNVIAPFNVVYNEPNRKIQITNKM
jgi:hypothetical protein